MKFLKNIKKKTDFILFFYLRINRRPSNRLATIWLKKDLYKFRNLETALDVGCGKFLNKRHFINKNYIGIDLILKTMKV